MDLGRANITVLYECVSAQLLVRRTHMEYTHLATGHGASRTELEPGLVWPIEPLWYSVATIVCRLRLLAAGSWMYRFWL